MADPTVTLSCSAGVWTAVVDNDGDVTTITPLAIASGRLVGSSGSVSVSIAHPCIPPTPAVVTYATTLESSACDYVVFSLGDPAICTDPYLGHSACANLMRLKVQQVCCPLAGWKGEGWYCIASASDDCSTGTKFAAELLEEDNCNTSIQICSGPYVDEAAAGEHCTVVAPVAVCTGQPEEIIVPSILYAHFSNGTGHYAPLTGVTVPMVHDPADLSSPDGAWKGCVGVGGGCAVVAHCYFECADEPKPRLIRGFRIVPAGCPMPVTVGSGAGTSYTFPPLVAGPEDLSGSALGCDNTTSAAAVTLQIDEVP